MLVHGYGIAAHPTLFLPVSNAIISYVAQHIPTVFTLPGFITLEIVLLFLSLWGIIYYLLRTSISLSMLLLVASLLCLRPVLLPQYTVTAGLLIIAAFLFLILCAKEKNAFYALIGVIFAWSGFLLRQQQFFLTLLITTPFFILLPRGTCFPSRKTTIVIAASIITLCTISSVIDYKSKHSPELRKYTEFLDAMIPVWNYGAGRALQQRPDILEKYQYSANDIKLLNSHFYETDQYTDTKTIRQMLIELGTAYKYDNGVSNGVMSLKAFFNPQLFPLILLSLALCCLLPLQGRERLVFISSLFLTLTIFFFIGALGRPGQLRIYFPVAALLVLLPVTLFYSNTGKWRRNTPCPQMAALFVAAACLLWHGTHMLPLAQQRTEWSLAARNAMNTLPDNEPIFSWGGIFPYEAIYPVFGDWRRFEKYDIPLFGGYTSAPFSTTTTKAKEGKGFLDLMQSPAGVLAFENLQGRCTSLLTVFAREHLGCEVRCEKKTYLPKVNIVRTRCQ